MEERETAVNVWISELLSGSFMKSEDSPGSVMLLTGTNVHRARLYGIIVSDQELAIDDGTGTIIVRSFDQNFNVKIGDPALVIGKPRLYNDQLYILGEIVKPIEIAWLRLREQKYPRPLQAQTDVLGIIRILDKGDGADYNEVVARLGTKGEEIILHLLAIGELFETKVGKLKVLE